MRLDAAAPIVQVAESDIPVAERGIGHAQLPQPPRCTSRGTSHGNRFQTMLDKSGTSP